MSQCPMPPAGLEDPRGPPTHQSLKVEDKIVEHDL